ncbi:hypothetical protein ABZ848_44450 [Streptomyces sp. NPDC047081]
MAEQVAEEGEGVGAAGAGVAEGRGGGAWAEDLNGTRTSRPSTLG